jgi:hypothetical protein
MRRGSALPGSGRPAITIGHPVADSVGFGRDNPEAPFVIDGSYLRTQSFNEMAARVGITMDCGG